MKPSQNSLNAQQRKSPAKKLTFAVALLVFVGWGFAARAQTAITNLFTTPISILANGVIGSGFDGVYLNFGDIPGGNNGGDGNGLTSEADTTNFPGFLTVESVNSSWAGAGDDGFFLYNVVQGDFDVSVDVAGPFNNPNYLFAGLLARAISDPTGGPYDPSGTNASENWVNITRFDEFGIDDQVRYATNANDVQITTPIPLEGTNGTGNIAAGDTNTDRFLRITRVGDTFTFYDKLLYTDPWTLEQTIPRPDLHAAMMEVGLEQATFTGNSAQTYFTDYGLVIATTLIPPSANPSAILVSSPASATSLKLSWAAAPGSDGSVVVVRENAPISEQPFDGVTFTNANAVFGAVTNMAADNQVVYAGSGTNVLISGLGGSNNIYNVAVYSYTTNHGTTPITYDTNPAVGIFNGPGALVSVSFVTAPPAIPVNGVGSAVVTACYTSGDCYDVSSSPDITLAVDNPAVLAISGGVMNGLSVGTANVTATFAGVSGTNVVTVHNAVFTDNFSVPHDYITNGLLGTSWDGEYLNFGDVPGGAFQTQGQGGDDAGKTFVLNADISDTNILALEAAGSSWEGAGDDGPFLFKIVTGDFQASVNINTMNNINLNAAGLMARLFDNSGSATQGAAGGNGGETHVNWWKVQAGALSARYTLDGALPTVQAGLSSADTWLLLQRFNSTNFLLFEKATPAALWSLAATFVVPEAANDAPMEVGIAEQMLTASDGTAQFDTFMLDGVGIVSPTGVQPPPPASGLTVTLDNDLSMTLDWTAESNGVPVQSMVVMRAGAPVSAQPPYGYLFDNGPEPFGAGSYLGDGNWVVYRSPNPPASISNSTVVTGLTPGTTYYAAVYTWVGSSTTKVFDEVIPPTGSSGEELDGVLTNIIVLPPPTIPAGGLGQLQVLGYYQGGAVVNVSQFADLTSGDTNIVDTADGVVTGYTNGTAMVTVTYAGYTNTVNVVVRSPSHADSFTTPHDYLNNGVAGTFFDGIYTNYGDVPEQGAQTAGNGGSTLDADAGMTTAGMLTITNGYSGWEFATDDGFFLFKYVPGDFQMAIHINNYSDTVNYTIPSIMARAYSVSTNGAAPNTGATVGAPLDGLGGECYVRMARFDEFGIGTYPEITIDDNSDQTTQPDPFDGQNWLLLVRQNYTNFNVYQRSTNTEPWHLTPNKTSFSNAKFAGVPMQVGIAFADFNAVYGYVQFDSFMLDAALEGTPLQVSSAGGLITITWPDYPGAVLQSSPILSLNPASWQTVSTLPAYSSGVATVTLPIGSGNLFFRLTQTAP